jgi:PAS domain S-box-containing protein
MSTRNDFQESEQGYRLLFESNPHPMWIYDRETLSFLAVNDAAVHHYGYSRLEFLAMTIRDIRPLEDVPWLLEKVSEVKPGMNSASGRHLKKGGELINVEIVSHTLSFGGKRAELVLSMDVSGYHKPQREQNKLVFGSEKANQSAVGPSSWFVDDQLTEAERRVARCVAQGFSNKQIAAELGLSVRTIENHISHILAKKQFSNRVEIARYVFEQNKVETQIGRGTA